MVARALYFEQFAHFNHIDRDAGFPLPPLIMSRGIMEGIIGGHHRGLGELKPMMKAFGSGREIPPVRYEEAVSKSASLRTMGSARKS